MSNTRKTVLFIVEGSSDKTALEKIFKSIYKGKKDIVFKFTHGDISSDGSISEENVCDEIYKIVKKYMDENKLKKTDIFQIVQIFDMDGAFIDDGAIIDGDENRIIYSTQNIECKDIEKVKTRNEKKRRMMNFLLKVEDIRNIPYETYYMSSNLDHALYNEQNLADELKQQYADRFYSIFLDKEKLFIEYLKAEVVNGVPDSYPASWRYIKEGLHSLERHTNLHIYFIKNPII